MATGNEKLQIDISAKDDASKVVDGLQKKVDKLEKGKTTVDVEADTKAAERDVDAFAKKIERLSGTDQVVSLGLRAAGVQNELSDLTQELAQLDSSDPTIDVKVGRITELTGELDQLKGKIKEIADTPLEPGGAAGGTGRAAQDRLREIGAGASDAREGVDKLSDSARGANSALANMVGNAAQDLGGLGGVVGSLGVGIGQMAEYAADASLAGEGLGSSLRSMAKVAIPIAGIAVAIGVVNEVMDEFKDKAKAAAEIKAFSDDNVKDFTKSLTEGTNVLDDYVAKLKEAGEVKARLDTPLIDPSENADNAVKTLVAIDNAMIDVGVSATQYAKAVTGSDADLQGFTAAVKSSNATVVNQQLVIEAAANAHDDYVTATGKAQKFALLFAATADQTSEAQRRAAESARLQGQANEYLAAEVAKAATEHEQLAASIAASDAQQAQANANSDAAQELIDGVNEALQAQVATLQAHVDALRADAEALRAQSDAFSSAADDQISYADATADFAAKLKDSDATTADLRDSAIGAAKAHAELYTSLTEASGASATATGQLDAQNQSLLESARSAKGPARQAILDYIGALNGIPPEQLTEIQADVKAGDLEAAQAKIDELSKNRELTVKADTSDADADVEQAKADAIKPVETPVKADTSRFDADVRTAKAAAARQVVVPVVMSPIYPPGLASGGKVGSGGGIVGETHQPEITTLPNGKVVLIDEPTFVPPGTSVIGVSDTRKALQGGESIPLLARGTQNINHTTLAAPSAPAAAVVVAADVKDAAKEALKAQDRMKSNAYELGRISRDEYLAYLNAQMAGTEDLSDDQVAYYRLIRGLQAETQREADAAAALNKKVADDQRKAAEDAAKAAEDEVKAQADRIRHAYEIAQAEMAVLQTEGAQGQAINEAVTTRGPERDGANEKAAEAVYRTILAKAKAADLDEGSVEWDRFVRALISAAQGNLAGTGIENNLNRYMAGIPALAKGGVVPATPGGQLVRVAEAGHAEAIVPLDQAGLTGGNVYNISIAVQTLTGKLSPRDEDFLANAVRNAGRRNGRAA